MTLTYQYSQSFELNKLPCPIKGLILLRIGQVCGAGVQYTHMKASNLTIGILLLVIIGLIGYLLTNSSSETAINESDTTQEQPIPVEPDGGIGDGAEPLDEMSAEERGDETVIGTSVEGNNITAYHFGTGDTEILLIGGVHGGYSWSTAALGYELVDYFDANPNEVPADITITIIPVANPDGLDAAVGTIGRFSTTLANALSIDTRTEARFNANDVDLNRNFDCDWSATGTWQNREVSGGSSAFSEPEAAAIRDYVNANNIEAAIVWFSSEGKVYPSACETTPAEDSVALAATFAAAADYPAEAEFDAYAITGDMVNWMAGKGIPAISVLLSAHNTTEFNQNLAGVEAVLNAYAN